METALSGQTPSVAWANDHGLVVWVNESGGIAATRLDALGAPVAVAPIPIAKQGAEPVVSWDGQGFLVAWVSTGFGKDIRATRVTASGQVSDPDGKPVCTAPFDQAQIALASNGKQSFLAWRDERYGPAFVYGARISANADVVDPDGFPVSSGAADPSSPSVSWDGTSWWLVWSACLAQDWDVRASRVDSSGVVLAGIAVMASDGTVAKAPTMGMSDAAFAALSSGFIAVGEPTWWKESPSKPVVARLCDASGVPQGPESWVSVMPNSQTQPAVIPYEDGALVAWNDDRGGVTRVRYSRLDSTGKPLGESSGIADSPAQADPALAPAQGSVLAVWREQSGLACRFMTADAPPGPVLELTTLSTSAPSADCSGSTCLVAWVDERNGGPDVWATRVTESGSVLDPKGILISKQGSGSAPVHVTHDAQGFRLVWLDGVGRVEAGGAVPDNESGGPFASQPKSSVRRFASNATHTLLAHAVAQKTFGGDTQVGDIHLAAIPTGAWWTESVGLSPSGGGCGCRVPVAPANDEGLAVLGACAVCALALRRRRGSAARAPSMQRREQRAAS